jgi:hypothetical protein
MSELQQHATVGDFTLLTDFKAFYHQIDETLLVSLLLLPEY